MSGIVFALAYTFQERLVRLFQENEKALAAMGQRFTAFFVTMQIILLLQSNHADVGGESMPEPYISFLRHLSFFTLDVIQLLPFDCIFSKGESQHASCTILWPTFLTSDGPLLPDRLQPLR